MAETIKILAQKDIPAAVLTDVYTVPALTSAVVSSLVFANRTAVDTTFRVSLAVGGAGDVVKQYLYYDVTLFGADTFIATIGTTLGAGDVVRVLVAAGATSVNVLGVEET